MAISSTPRFGLTQWSAGTDAYRRTQIHNSLGSVESQAAGIVQGTVLPTAGAEFEGFFFFDIDTNQLSYCDGVEWWTIVGAEGGFGGPAALLVSDTVGSDGVANTANRANHVHLMPGFANPTTVGTSLGEGAAETVARANHVHNLADGAINSSTMFGANIVGSNALAPNSVTNSKIADGAVTGSKMLGSTIGTTKFQNLSVTEAKLANGAAAGSKLSGIDVSKVTSGILGAARIPGLDVSKITTGSIGESLIPDSIYAPTGMITMHSAEAAPLAGEWLLCDGSEVSRATYSDLDDIMSAEGYPFGNGNGSTTFNVPNFTGRHPLGLRSSGTASSTGDTGGSFDHVHSNPIHAHVVDPASTSTTSAGSHNHSNSALAAAGSHDHALADNTADATGDGFTGGASTAGLVPVNSISHSHSHSHGDGSYAANSDGNHSHGIVNSSSSASPSYTVPENAYGHTHANTSADANASHVHSLGDTGSTGSHSHTVNILSFNSANGGSTDTDASNAPYLAVTFWIKT